MDRLQQIRELLIETCYSNEKASKYFESKIDDQNMLQILVSIAVDEDDFGGDAPMAAGSYIPMYPVPMLKEYEKEFLDILVREYSDARPEDIALALAKIQSSAAKPIIEQNIKELEYGPRCEIFEEALKLYES